MNKARIILNYLINELLANKYHYLLLLIVIILSGFIRYKPLIEGNFPFLFDHGRDMVDVKKIVVEHNLTLIGPFTGLKGVFHGALHYYLLAIPFILTGGNPASPTYFLATLSLIGIISIYFIYSRLFNRTTALLAAIIFAFATGSLDATKHFWNPHWIPFLMIFWLAAFYTGIFLRRIHLVTAFFLAGIIAQCDIAFGIVLIPVMLAGMLIFQRNLFATKYFVLSILAFIMTFSTHILFELRHDFLMTNAIFNLLRGNNTSLGLPIEFPTRIYYRIDELQKATIFSLTGDKVLAYIFLLVSGSAIFLSNLKKQKKELTTFFFLLLPPIVYLLFFLLYPRAAWSWYWVGLQVPYYFTVAYAFWVLSKAIPKSKYVLSAVIIIFSVMALIPGPTDFLETEPGIFNNEMRAIQTVYNDANGRPFGLFVYTPPIYTYHYDYLTWWYARSNNISQPGQSKQELFYLILEEDKQNPHAPTGWKETVVKEGKTIWTKKLPGNLTVERREGVNFVE